MACTNHQLSFSRYAFIAIQIYKDRFVIQVIVKISCNKTIHNLKKLTNIN